MDKFVEELIEELKDVLDETCAPVPIKAKKNNKLVYTGIRFDKKGKNVSPTIYVDDMYQNYIRGRYTMLDVVLHIQDMLKQQVEVGDVVNEIQQYEGAKPKLRVALLNYSANQEVLEERVYKQFLDLAAVSFIEVITENGVDGMIYVTDNLVQKWGVDKETILNQSIQNMMTKERFFMASPEDILSGHYGFVAENDTDFAEAKGGVYFISNERKQYGAKIMLNTDFLHKIAIKHDSNLIIYPSSIHEIFVTVEDRFMGKMLRADDIQMINEHKVLIEEQLSNSVYYYDRERKEVSIREAGKPLCEGME